MDLCGTEICYSDINRQCAAVHVIRKEATLARDHLSVAKVRRTAHSAEILFVFPSDGKAGLFLVFHFKSRTGTLPQK